MFFSVVVTIYIIFCSAPNELPGDTSSLGDIMEESDWEVNSDLGLLGSPIGLTPTKGSAQAEKEIR